jgi:hypothetical protein
MMALTFVLLLPGLFDQEAEVFRSMFRLSNQSSLWLAMLVD